MTLKAGDEASHLAKAKTRSFYYYFISVSSAFFQRGTRGVDQLLSHRNCSIFNTWGWNFSTELVHRSNYGKQHTQDCYNNVYHAWLFLWALGSNSGSHVCTTNTLLMKLSPDGLPWTLPTLIKHTVHRAQGWGDSPQVLYLLNGVWLGLLQIHLILQTEKEAGISYFLNVPQ